jgi:hypothetical protein
VAKRTLNDIYESYVKPLSPDERRRLIQMTARDLDGDPSALAEQAERNLLELHGLGNELWRGIDAQQYVDHLRSEWTPGS